MRAWALNLGCTALVIAAVVSSCVGTEQQQCDWGDLCPSGSTCHFLTQSCVLKEQLVACRGHAEGEACEVGSTSEGMICDREVCIQPRCGDAVITADEECDDGALNSDTRPDACRTTCRLAHCGDAVVDPGEQCDGTNLGGETCGSQVPGYGGVLRCRADCAFELSGCAVCDVGYEGELCDRCVTPYVLEDGICTDPLPPVCRYNGGWALRGMPGDAHHGPTDFAFGGTPEEPTVMDLITGLEWRACPPGQTWVNDRCEGDPTLRTFAGVATFCAGEWGGHDDWRVPQLGEYESLFDYDSLDPRLDEDYFRGVTPWRDPTHQVTGGHWFWSATMESRGNRGIMILWTTTSTWPDNNLGPVFCVRNGSRGAPRRMTLQDCDGSVVTDTWTGMQWQRCSFGQTWDGAACVGEQSEVTMAMAEVICTARQLGYSDWRLPTARELRSVRRYCDGDILVDEAAFPGTAGTYYWSSTTLADRPDTPIRVHFGYERIDTTAATTLGVIRCVRDDDGSPPEGCD